MNVTQQGLVRLLRSGITGQTQSLPDGFSLEDGMALIRQHHMAPLIYEGAVCCGIGLQEEAMQKLFRAYCKAVMVSDGQMQQLQRLYAAFEAAGIDYMPLKGCNMKLRYPKPELRGMGDADILIRTEQYDAIVPVLEELGFTFKLESDHELVWQSDKLYLELHKRLIPSYNEDYHGYFGNGWDFARPGKGYRYDMTAEDEFVYLFGHFAKHFRDGGIGCRYVVDLWVFLREHPNLNMEQVTSSLEKLQLLEFFCHIRRLIRWWLEDGQEDEHLEMISEFIFSSGSWGQMESKILAWNIRTTGHAPSALGGRVGHIWRLVFPSAKRLEKKYTVLQKAPWLLPAVWVYRPVYKLLFERKSFRQEEQTLKVLSKENLDTRKAMLKAVGLEFRS